MVIVESLGDFKQRERPRSLRHERAKDEGDSRSKSGSPKATDDEQNGDEGRHRHHKKEKKHEGSHKHGDSRDHKARVGPRGGCFYYAGPHYRRDCPHKGKIIAFLEKHKSSKGDSSSSDGEARIGALQMVNAFMQKVKRDLEARNGDSCFQLHHNPLLQLGQRCFCWKSFHSPPKRLRGWGRCLLRELLQWGSAVADGVSGWAEKNVDPAKFSREMMTKASALVPEKERDPRSG
ncbi:hypothetical protein RJ640_001028 [Escallonia rubra]|uniref:Uncharacterized protein n=1 Tax=Escallonia rubra TaxID=112253 RepID=A0AA88QNS5_9ASTE|nr:hypothetical protein RJ640_001028 [Escallonia rubra]